MSIITTMTRNYLTRSFRPFIFENKDREMPQFMECENLGLYVHIPFCEKICSFCPYCKEIFDKDKCDRYVDALIREIEIAGSRMTTKKMTTSLYFGGGTPALAAARIGEIIEKIKTYFEISDGIGVELHPDNVDANTLETLKNAGVTRISIGVQTFDEALSNVLGRRLIDTEKLSLALSKVKFETVSMDFIFALPGQTFEKLRSDIDLAFRIGANHVAIYPFIDFTFVPSKIAPMNNRDKRRLLDEITIYLESVGCSRDSIWTFSTTKGARYSSMTRETFLGFGCSATSLTRDKFKINTFSVDEYIKCIDEGVIPTALSLSFSKRQRMLYHIFWTTYTTRLNPSDFERFFGEKIERSYGFELFIARLFKLATKENGVYQLTKKGVFYYHYYENYYTLSYIDKMWRIMRREAFPEKITF